MKNDTVKDKSPINLGFTLSYIRYISENDKDYFNKLVDLFIKEFKCEDFRNLPNNAIEQAIDVATGFGGEMQKSFDEFLLMMYESMWEEKHNDFFDKLFTILLDK